MQKKKKKKEKKTERRLVTALYDMWCKMTEVSSVEWGQ